MLHHSKSVTLFFTKTTNVTNVTNVTLFLDINVGSSASTSFPSTACFSLSLSPSRPKIEILAHFCTLTRVNRFPRFLTHISQFAQLCTSRVTSEQISEIFRPDFPRFPTKISHNAKAGFCSLSIAGGASHGVAPDTQLANRFSYLGKTYKN